MSDIDCNCICIHCNNPLNHTNDNTCYDTRMAFGDLLDCDCDSCYSRMIDLYTCSDCYVDDYEDIETMPSIHQ